ncbi:NrdE [Bacillus phage v_B-Bak6]|uniref:Ribonucleoside-diphosphate reductase n=1 Tax=Bacillus phage Basilisk TaxID=1296654 RepID=S5M863_9CAUD|nr:ribonucleotide reductase [Bacillus phage Basilisk]AGR46633.1 NrdE [Bacillus phage Basilisk]AXY83042.1 NrdE [Bacillus phage v_B-Bak1]AXY83162.1 NrdE [Bacillus phage v_B-Bak6]
MSRWVELNNEVTTKVDGKYQLHKDVEAVRSYFMDYINDNLRSFLDFEEKINYMVNEKYYDKEVLDQYTPKQVEELFNHAYSFNFRFPSFMSALKFFTDYALMNREGTRYLERYEDRVSMTALFLGRGSFKSAMNICDRMMKQRYQPATPTFLNAGKYARGEMVSCFLLDVNDSMNDIAFRIANSLELSKLGGGVALNLTGLRSKGDPIKGIDNRASGVVPVMKLLEDSFSYANQLGARKGSGVAYLNIFHWDIVDFLDTKKINTDEKTRIQSLSIGVSVPDKFLELAENDEEFYMFSPYDVKKEYGLAIDEIDWDTMYDEVVNNPNVKKKKMSAAEMWTDYIMRVLFESGYPYVMFEGNVNNQHPLKYLGRVKKSNLCTEILQYSSDTTKADYGEEDDLGFDISCNLGALNIVNVMEGKDLKGDTFAGMDALTAVTDFSNIENVPTIKKANDFMKSVGLGFMNLHGYLAKNGIPYGSKASIDFARTFFSTINFYTIVRSNQMAVERDSIFYGFDKSTYATGEYFEPHIAEDYRPKTKKVQKLFEGIHIPTQEEWQLLKESVMKYGLYHSYRLASAPTGGISYVQNATQGVLPIVNLIEARTTNKFTVQYPAPFLEEAEAYYESAYDIDPFKIVDVIAEIQKHIDQGISFTIHYKGEPNTRHLGRIYAYAYKKGIKTIYYVRTKLTQVTECEACTV